MTLNFGRFFGVAALALGLAAAPAVQAQTNLLNVSYDPTRELYQDYNAVFARYWQAKTHQTVTIKQSHGGSGKQARAVIDGLEADVVTLGLPSDITAIQQQGLINADWRSRFPGNATPYFSTVVLVVRKGNPKGIHDFGDLARPGVQIVTPNPKTSAGGRMAYLAAYGWSLTKSHGNDATARGFIGSVYRNVIKLDSGARGATITFTQRAQGDVLIAWENEADLIRQQGHGQYQVIVPSASVFAEPAVAVVDKNVDKHNTRAVATAYLQYLYSPQGQAIAAKHFYRPRNPAVAKRFKTQFPNIPLFTVERLFGGWDNVQKVHFADGGVFDQIYARHR